MTSFPTSQLITGTEFRSSAQNVSEKSLRLICHAPLLGPELRHSCKRTSLVCRVPARDVTEGRLISIALHTQRTPLRGQKMPLLLLLYA